MLVLRAKKPNNLELGASQQTGYPQCSRLNPDPINVALTLLDSRNYGFPDPQTAAVDPNGLLAIGGDLAPERLLAAYARGIFPWFESDSDPIMWWSPDPRAVLVPAEFRPHRSLRKTLRKGTYCMTADRAFGAVVRGCASASRPGQAGTWITDDMCAAYESLHASGVAHSIETWQDGRLVGGLYGLSLGQMFFGESMFSHARDASKCAFAQLCAQLSAWNFRLIDCQMMNDHLASLGVVQIARSEFMRRLKHNDLSLTRKGAWQLDCLAASQ